MPDVNVFLVNFPCLEEERVVPNEDSSYTIMINARLSHERQIEAYYHALKHISEDDFYKENVQMIESNAHEEEGTYKNAKIN